MFGGAPLGTASIRLRNPRWAGGDTGAVYGVDVEYIDAQGVAISSEYLELPRDEQDEYPQLSRLQAVADTFNAGKLRNTRRP